MTDGLYLIIIPAGYYRYVLIGWCRVDGLEIRLRNSVSLKHWGDRPDPALLAALGPSRGTEFYTAAPLEYAWRPNLLRAIPADAAVWARHCPKPPDWD